MGSRSQLMKNESRSHFSQSFYTREHFADLHNMEKLVIHTGHLLCWSWTEYKLIWMRVSYLKRLLTLS